MCGSGGSDPGPAPAALVRCPPTHACLARARGLLQSLDGGPAEPIVLLLTHCFFAAEAERLPEVRGLRALLVRYPQPRRLGVPRDAGAFALAPTLEPRASPP
jgi:hypothetical protein